VVDCINDRKGKYAPIGDMILIEQTQFSPVFADYVNATLHNIPAEKIVLAEELINNITTDVYNLPIHDYWTEIVGIFHDRLKCFTK
jgi:hypothetical protein